MIEFVITWPLAMPPEPQNHLKMDNWYYYLQLWMWQWPCAHFFKDPTQMSKLPEQSPLDLWLPETMRKWVVLDKLSFFFHFYHMLPIDHQKFKRQKKRWFDIFFLLLVGEHENVLLSAGIKEKSNFVTLSLIWQNRDFCISCNVRFHVSILKIYRER